MGGPFQHRHAAPVAAFGNTTQMQDHCGNTITAKARKYETDTCGNDICAPNCNDCPGGEDLVTNTPEPPKISENTWSESGTVQLEPCRKLGGKLVQAYKAWHGDFGFNYNPDGTACDSGANSNTKYRSKRMYASLTDSGGNTWTQLRKITLDKYGVASLVECSDVTPSGMDPMAVIATDLTSSPRCSSDTATIASYLSECDPGTVTTGSSGSAGWISDSTSGSPVKTLEVASTRSDSSYSWTVTQRTYLGDVIGLYTGSIDLSDAYTITDVLSDASDQSALWVLTDDLKHPFRTDKHTTVAPFVFRNEATPSSPSIFPNCTVDDYTSPVDDADGNHPFDSGWTPTWGQRAWFDPNAYVWKYSPPTNSTEVAANTLTLLYDGAMIGGPLASGYGQPVGGNPRGVFDKDHENWMRRNCTLGVGWTQASESRGGFTPDYLPANAQKWTDDFHATTLYPCAFINSDTSGVYLQKWSEVQIKRPSINFARPFGPDKFTLDETAIFYVSDFTAGVVTLQTVDFATPTSLPFTTGDIVGSAAVGGFFAVASVGTDTVTLGALVYDLPAGWATPSRDGSFCFGKLRFPNAPGMNFTDTGAEVGGRVSITVTDGSPVTLTTATAQKYLSITTPENIDILDATMTALATNVAATRVSDTEFQVPSSFATIAAAKWIVPHLLNDGTTTGQKYKFADDRNKGDYVYRTWTVRLSDATVLATTQQDACLKFTPCGPSVAGITPNSETSSNGHFWGFPTSINNGELWLGQIQFWMPDPFWQQPHTPVAVNDSHEDFEPGVDLITWTEDGGGCTEDSSEVGGGGETIFHLVYAMRPYVEARCTLPDDIGGEPPPALASGTDLTAVADPPAQAGIGNAEGPLVDAIVIPVPTWVKYLAQLGCVQTAGRFASDYEANGTTA